MTVSQSSHSTISFACAYAILVAMVTKHTAVRFWMAFSQKEGVDEFSVPAALLIAQVSIVTARLVGKAGARVGVFCRKLFMV